MFLSLIKFDLLCHARHVSHIIGVLAFFAMTTVILSMGVGPDREILQGLGAEIVWTTALLASMLSMGELFEDDYNDGMLEQLVIQPMLVASIVLSKILSHWIMTGIPLVLLAPFLLLLFYIDTAEIAGIIGVLSVGTFILSCLGVLASAVTVGIRRREILIALIVMPLFIPVLIFGVAAMDGQEGGLLMLAGLLLFLLPLCLWSASCSLKAALES